MTEFEAVFEDQAVMAILRGHPVSRAVSLAQRAWDLGISTVEVTVETPSAVQVLAAVVAAGRERGEGVGAGTVTTQEQVAAVADVGARFTVAPGFDAAIARASVARGMPHLPGVATATEIQQVLAAGHRWVKAFPAATLGESWFRSVRGPFPYLKIVATGGVTASNARRFLHAGADVVAVGSALEEDEELEALSDLVAAVQQQRGRSGP